MEQCDKVIIFGYLDGYTYELNGITNYVVALETGERVEIPVGGVMSVDEFVEKDKIKLKDVIARLDGYEVEKEKRYLVKVKGVYLNSCLVFDKGNKKWFFSSIYEIDHQIGHHTRKELEQANFGWVFDCEGMEVKEV